MSIEFHCNHCDKLVRAPDASGGKRGKCPYCKQSVYVPMPRDEVDEIPIAPLDADAEAQRARLEAEADRLKKELNRERDAPAETTREMRGSGVVRPEPRTAIDIEPKVVDYVIALKNAQLDQAQALIPDLRRSGEAAKQVVQRLMMDELPPAGLEDIPTPVLRGFFRKLLDQL